MATDTVDVADCINKMILAGRIYVDLRVHRVVEVERAPAYEDAVTARAWDIATTSRLDSSYRGAVIRRVEGERVAWDGQPMEIVHVGEKEVYLRSLGDDSKLPHLPHDAFEGYVRTGAITPLDGGAKEHSDAQIAEGIGDILSRASTADRQKANDKRDAIDPWLGDDPPTPIRAMPHTLRRALTAYKRAQLEYNCGYVGLLSKRLLGNPTPKIPAKANELLTWYIENKYEVPNGPTRYAAWTEFKQDCEARSVEQPADYPNPAPSFVTFCDRVKKRPKGEQTRKRMGPRAAKKYEPWYWELNQTTPRHGDRPLHIAHIDHTQLDIEVIDSVTGRNLGRPWWSPVMDANSRRLLSYYLSFRPPSATSDLMVMRLCALRWGRVPQILVYDGGPDFRSIAFQTFLNRYEVTRKQRPWHDPHFGSVCERLIGTTMTEFINLLKGNTQITKSIRLMTKSVDPRRLTPWTLSDLNAALFAWADDFYDQTTHSSLGMSPRQAWERGMVRAGRRDHMLIADMEEVRRLSMVSPKPKGTRKVSEEGRIVIDHITYGCDDFDSSMLRQTVDVIQDPFDAGKAEAFVKGKWRELTPDYRASFLGRSPFEVAMATEELHRRDLLSGRDYLTVTAKRLAAFLTTEVHQREDFLVQQRKDQEQAKVREQLFVQYGGLASHPEIADPSANSALLAPPVALPLLSIQDHGRGATDDRPEKNFKRLI